MSRIPKILHYCSFGGSFDVDSSIIESWKKYCPDYEIICWNESNFDINCCTYVKQAYENKKWAFVSDVARLTALENYGGIYLDTDVELVKNLDKFLNHGVFFGFENDTRVGTAIIGSTPNNPIIFDLLCDYFHREFTSSQGDNDLTTNVQRVSEYLKKHGFPLNGSYVDRVNVALYPKDYFYPKDFVTGKLNMTSHTCAIHHYNASWKTQEEDMRDKLFFRLKSKLPEKFSWNLASYFSAVRHRGIFTAHRDMIKLLAGKKG